jgi:hypothetical protein
MVRIKQQFPEISTNICCMFASTVRAGRLAEAKYFTILWKISNKRGFKM